MDKRIFRFDFVISFTLLLVSLFILGSVGFVSAQGTPKLEICNGKDDNGDGVVDENVTCDHYLSYLLDKYRKTLRVRAVILIHPDVKFLE